MARLVSVQCGQQAPRCRRGEPGYLELLLGQCWSQLQCDATTSFFIRLITGQAAWCRWHLQACRKPIHCLMLTMFHSEIECLDRNTMTSILLQGACWWNATTDKQSQTHENKMCV